MYSKILVVLLRAPTIRLVRSLLPHLTHFLSTCQGPKRVSSAYTSKPPLCLRSVVPPSRGLHESWQRNTSIATTLPPCMHPLHYHSLYIPSKTTTRVTFQRIVGKFSYPPPNSERHTKSSCHPPSHSGRPSRRHDARASKHRKRRQFFAEAVAWQILGRLPSRMTFAIMAGGESTGPGEQARPGINA